MKPYTDEHLSAFLDGELTAVQMEEMRHALAADDSLADRLAQLAELDAQVQAQARAIDSHPLPMAVWEMLRPKQAGKVVDLQGWRARLAAGHMGYARAAVAAGFTLVLGLLVGQWLPQGMDSGPAAALANSLDRIPSGRRLELEAGRTFESRLSFIDRQQRFCRQYLLQDAGQASENIACRTSSGDWELVASAMSSRILSADEFQPASSAQLLEGTLVSLMSGSPLGLEEESIWLRAE